MNVTIGYKTDKGLQRDTSEDRCKAFGRAELYNRLDLLLVIADGMGGAYGGGVAADTVMQTFSEVKYEILVDRYGGQAAPDPTRLMRDFFSRANFDVLHRAATSSDYPRMGTTCVAAMLRGNQLTIGHVGDSRAYLLRAGQLRQLTEDHSDVWEQVKTGHMSREEARVSQFRNRLNRYIGMQDALPDVQTHALEPGDTVLLCTDGLTTEVPDLDIARILATAPDAQSACDALVEVALRNGGSDNVTVMTLRYGPFTPLALADSVTVEIPEATPTEEEDATDPEPAWRGSASRPAAFPSEAPSRLPDRVTERESRAEPFSRREAEADGRAREAEMGLSGLARALVIVLALMVVGQGVALYVALKYRNVPPPTLQAPAHPKTTASNTLPAGQLPTDKPLDYLEPQLVYAGPLREAPLLHDANDEMLAVTQDGKLARLDPEGNITYLAPVGPTTEADLVAPVVARRTEADDTVAETKLVYMTLDASGNRYQINTATRSIDKFNATGTRVRSEIGKGFLKAPASLIVDNNGNIFVIDNRQLKMIPARPTRTRGAGRRLPTASTAP